MEKIKKLTIRRLIESIEGWSMYLFFRSACLRYIATNISVKMVYSPFGPNSSLLNSVRKIESHFGPILFRSILNLSLFLTKLDDC